MPGLLPVGRGTPAERGASSVSRCPAPPDRQSFESTPLLGTPTKIEIMEGGRKWTQHLAALAACLSALSVGTTMSWTSAASIPLQDKNNDFHVSVNEFSWVSAILAIGAMLGAVPLGILANTVGRKKLVLILAPFMIVGYLLLVWASELWMLLLGRFINGIITGAYCVIPSMYTSEIAEDSIRGVLGSYFQLLITMGILFNYVLDALELSLTGVSIACACVPAVLFIVLLFFPDTPRWYLSKGRREEAQKSLQYFRGLENVDKELESIQSSIDMQRAEKLPLTKAFSTTAAKKGLFLALFVMIFQQFSGINAVIFYSSDIFRDANVGLEPKVSTVIVGVFQVLATYISTLLVDRLGRRPLLLMSGALMAISGGLLGVYFYLDQKTSVTEDVDISWLPIVCMIVFIVFFSLGMGPIPWLYMGEVFSDQIKESAMSVATVTNWLSVFVVTKFYGDLSESIGNYSTFWIFSGISIIGCFFTTFCLVETKGKDFTAILSELGGGNVSSLRNGTAHPQEERI